MSAPVAVVEGVALPEPVAVMAARWHKGIPGEVRTFPPPWPSFAGGPRPWLAARSRHPTGPAMPVWLPVARGRPSWQWSPACRCAWIAGRLAQVCTSRDQHGGRVTLQAVKLTGVAVDRAMAANVGKVLMGHVAACSAPN